VKRKRRIFGFTLIELLVVVAIIALLISILLPSLSRARELSKRVVCASNESGLGKSCKIYANDNEELWPVPGFSASYTNTGTNRIKYVKDSTNGVGGTGAPFPPSSGTQTPNRSSISQGDNPPSGAQSSTQLSVTRALWMLVRSGDVQTKGFICPSSGDTTDPTTEIDAYYDFMDIANISYGYLVPFGPTQTRPSENLDSRLALSADKGPLYDNVTYPFTSGSIFPDEKSSPNDWRAYNSGNHGGRGAGEGQNVLFHDGHSSFERTPIVGVDQDNIYTVMINGDQAAQPNKQGRQIGGSPHVANASYAPANPAPGDRTFKGTTGFGNYATTDSLIYP
jgi:prepilin-type N-terminal cleavage/methylation domain-containing protein